MRNHPQTDPAEPDADAPSGDFYDAVDVVVPGDEFWVVEHEARYFEARGSPSPTTYVVTVREARGLSVLGRFSDRERCDGGPETAWWPRARLADRGYTVARPRPPRARLEQHAQGHAETP